MAYMLRIWRATDKGQVTWRASLEDPTTGDRQGFANLDRLISYLETQMAPESSEDADEGGEWSDSQSVDHELSL
jgi:hypothetical protein